MEESEPIGYLHCRISPVGMHRRKFTSSLGRLVMLKMIQVILPFISVYYLDLLRLNAFEAGLRESVCFFSGTTAAVSNSSRHQTQHWTYKGHLRCLDHCILYDREGSSEDLDDCRLHDCDVGPSGRGSALERRVEI